MLWWLSISINVLHQEYISLGATGQAFPYWKYNCASENKIFKQQVARIFTKTISVVIDMLWFNLLYSCVNFESLFYKFSVILNLYIYLKNWSIGDVKFDLSSNTLNFLTGDFRKTGLPSCVFIILFAFNACLVIVDIPTSVTGISLCAKNRSKSWREFSYWYST